MTLCESTAMDYALYGSTDTPVEPCDEIGVVEVDGYTLCPGCTEALEALGMLGKACRRRSRA